MIDILSRQLALKASTKATSALSQIAALTGSRQAIIPTMLGAIGDGAHPTQDQAAFASAITALIASASNVPDGTWDLSQYQNGLAIEPGVYNAGNLTITGNGNVHLVARIPGTVVIVVPSSQYFLQIAGYVNSFNCDGIVFVGGNGAVHFTGTGNSVGGIVRFTRCMFVNYAVASITNESSDQPYVKIDNCVFYGTSTSKAIAWGGDSAGMTIRDNVFLLNAYHIKLSSPNGAVLIEKNDFIEFSNGVRQADIWLTPTASATIRDNKFGPENTTTPATRILIANEDTSSGSTRAAHPPITTLTTGTASNLIIEDNICSENTGGVPFITCYVKEVDNWQMRGNAFQGAEYSYVVSFPNGVAADATSESSFFEFQIASSSGGNRPAKRFADATFAMVHDYGCFWPGDANMVEVYPVSDNPLLGVVVNGLVPSLRGNYGSVTRTIIPDGDGTLMWENVVVSGNSTGEIIGFNPGAAGGRFFLEVELGQATANTLAQIKVEVFNYSNNAFALSREVVLPANVSSFRLPVHIPANASPGSWQLRVYCDANSGYVSGTANAFTIGRMLLNSGAGRIGRKAVLDKYLPVPRNRTMLGAASGAFPTGWVWNGVAGLTASVVDGGCDASGYYFDLSLSGTTSAAGTCYLRCDTSKSIAIAAGSTTWEYIWPLLLQSGSFANFTAQSGADGTSGPVGVHYVAYNTAGIYAGENSLTACTPGASIGTYGSSGSYSGAGFADPCLVVQFASGVAVSAVIRVYQPTIRRVV